jgi:hypothetical protein
MKYGDNESGLFDGKSKDVLISGIHPCRRGPTGATGGIADFAFVASTEAQTVDDADTPGGQGGAVTFNNSLVTGTALSFNYGSGSGDQPY